MKTYPQGATAVLTCDVTTRAGAAADPATSMTIVIAKPDGTAGQASTNMTQDGTGDYSYAYAIASDALLGVWPYECVADNNPNVTIGKSRFEVKRRAT